MPGGFIASAVTAGVLAAALSNHAASAAPAGNTASAPGNAPSAAIAYARAQLGKPYLWGGTGPGAFDCSGLAQAAYATAGIPIARTSQAQWASERHVSSPQPGDLVFFAGADGTPASPGHVGIVTDPSRHLMIDAYGAGTAVRYDTYGPASPAPGLSDPAGYTQPWGA